MREERQIYSNNPWQGLFNVNSKNKIIGQVQFVTVFEHNRKKTSKNGFNQVLLVFLFY